MKDSIKREQNKPVCSAERENQRSLAEGKSNFRTKCKMKKVFKKVFLTVMALIACVLILCLGFWLIDGRSPQAYLVAHALPRTTMEAYEKGKFLNKVAHVDYSTLQEYVDIFGYGNSSETVIDNRAISILPLAHPRQIGALGSHSEKWNLAHLDWEKSR